MIQYRTKEKVWRQAILCGINLWMRGYTLRRGEAELKCLLLTMLLAPTLLAQSHKTDPTWLYRHLPALGAPVSDHPSESCHYQAIFGQGDTDAPNLRSVSRFGETQIAPHSNCADDVGSQEEELLFVLRGKGFLRYEEESHGLRHGDFTYLHPGLKHFLRNDSDESLRVLVMGFRIPQQLAIDAPSQAPKIVNLDEVREETVDGHPSIKLT